MYRSLINPNQGSIHALPGKSIISSASAVKSMSVPSARRWNFSSGSYPSAVLVRIRSSSRVISPLNTS